MMSGTHSLATWRRIAQQFAPDLMLTQADPLFGGFSAQTTVLTLENAHKEPVRWVVREHGDIDRTANPHIARDEYRLLKHLEDAQIPVPKPLYVDETDTFLPMPYIIVSFVEGKTDLPQNLAHAVEQLAQMLVNIHRVDTRPLSFLPAVEVGVRRLLNPPPVVDGTFPEKEIRAFLADYDLIGSLKHLCLLHGDYWHGNILWQGDQLAAVLDWEDASLGDPLVELAKARLELLWTAGAQTMRDFTACYQRLTGIDLATLPLWDLWVSLKPALRFSLWAADAQYEQHMRTQHAWFIQQAFDQINTR